ncbi:Bifunctional phosphoglucose/phosphomannose isomerase [Candidatus Tiddalikarchaeum anstoanum]|nr:Bifunctional phosphoglucose/phosphomannose isomerase [Candidatus Tiddalikarchaeum anstoanum]
MEKPDEFKKILLDFDKQFNEAKKLGANIKFEDIKNVIVCGMGGSALAGDFVRTIFYPNLRITVLKDYLLPDYVDNTWLCICISYSGNTEETISAYEQAVKKTKNVAVICSGGKLAELSKKNNNQLIIVPTGLQPRLAFAYQALPIINILTNSNIVKFDIEKEGKQVDNIVWTDFEKEANKTMENLEGTPIIYVSSRNDAVGYKWKISFNENAKTPAFYNVYPEFNHNEINGFGNTSNKFTIIMVTDSEDYIRVKKRFAVVTDIFREKGLNIIELKLEGKNRLAKLVYGMLLADWVSYLYAKKTGVDPMNVPIVEDLKKRLRP